MTRDKIFKTLDTWLPTYYNFVCNSVFKRRSTVLKIFTYLYDFTIYFDQENIRGLLSQYRVSTPSKTENKPINQKQNVNPYKDYK